MSALSTRAGSAALVWALTAVCHAETAVSEAAVAGVNLQRMQSANGGSIDVDWVETAEKRVVTAGAGFTKIGDSQWAVLRGAMSQIGDVLPAVSGSVDIGPGSNDGDQFTYLKLGVGISAPLTERWRFFARDTYVDIEPVSGHIVTLGADTMRRSGLSLQLQASRSTSGSLDERGHLVRIDYRARPPYLTGGVAVTRTNDRFALGAAPTDISTTNVREAFVGMSLPVRGGELTITAQLGNVGGVQRRGLSVFVRSAIASRG